MINPIFASSARRRMRTIKTPLIVTLYGLTLLAFTIIYLSPLNGDTLRVTTMRKGTECYIYLIVLQFMLTLLAAPAMTAGSIAGERERKTLDLLLVTNTSSLRIMMGKLMESFSFLALLIFSSLPILSIVFMTGGITLAQILTALLFMLLTAFVALSIGLFASAIFKRTVSATVAAYVMILVLGGATLLFAPACAPDYTNITLAAGATLDPSLIPWPLYLNPAMGLLALAADQTMLLKSTLQNLFYQFNFYLPIDSINFTQFIWYNIGAMAGSGVLLVGLSAFLIRPRKKAQKRTRGA